MGAKAKENRLGGEKSPYLLLHKDNPVDWYPWGEEAFSRAKSQNRPVFLSIGYSACHWCHVMARESFEDGEVAELLNKHFVSVKVDREERPDVDHVYMEVCQMLTGSGGWPLTVILTPELKPFYAGTYFPKESKYGMPGLLELLGAIAKAWAEDRDRLMRRAGEITTELRRMNESTHERRREDAPQGGANAAAEALLRRAFNSYSAVFDEANGGFGAAPKFPSAHNLLFLLRYWKRTGERRALEMVEKTLSHAYRGGIYDHLGLGFFRYSTDARWMAPHFEKMLYDNAMMLMAYSELAQATQREACKAVAREVATFLEDGMGSPEGAFYSAIDAESEGEEGKFYVWTPAEIVSILGSEAGERFCAAYGITETGNFHGKSVPHLATGRDADSLLRAPVLERSRAKILEARSRRPEPRVDDKILTSWNSLAVAALAKASRACGSQRLLERARKCLDFIEKAMVKGETVYARYRDGDVAIPGYLDDYACLVWALLEMREATQDDACLGRAADLADLMVGRFWDDRAKSFFLTAAGSEPLIVRPKQVNDGAMPSGNSVAVMDLLRLAHLLDREDFEERAMESIEALMESVSGYPQAFGHLLSAIEYAMGGAQDVTVHDAAGDPRLGPMLDFLGEEYLPDAQVRFVRSDRAYMLVCRDRKCSAELASVDELKREIKAF